MYNDVHSLCTKLYAHVANSSFFPVIEPRTTLYSFPPRSFHHRVRFACRNVLKHRRRPLRSNDTVAPKSGSDTRNPLVPRDFDFSLPLAHPFSLDERYASVVPAPFSPCCSIRARFFFTVDDTFLESSRHFANFESKYMFLLTSLRFSCSSFIFLLLVK